MEEFTNTMGNDPEKNDRERRAKLRLRVISMVCNVFEEIMDADSSSRMKWCGTMTDLAELTSIAYNSRGFTAPDGRLLSFNRMYAHVCSVLHCRQASNPYSMVSRARNRKGVFNLSVIDRYINLILDGGIVNPMRLDMRRML